MKNLRLNLIVIIVFCSTDSYQQHHIIIFTIITNFIPRPNLYTMLNVKFSGPVVIIDRLKQIFPSI